MILWLNPAAGISGDMILGALLGLGAPLDDVRAAVAATGLTGWSLERHSVTRGGLVATRAEVTVTDTATERPAAVLLDMVGRATPAPVAALASRVVRLLAETEATLHDTTPDAVHLHEIGGVDTVVDTVGVAAALHLLGVEEVHTGPVGIGHGTVATAHGVLPVPAPATAALLAGLPVAGLDVAMETATPTGVALLRAADARPGPLPAMTVRTTAYGAGSRDPAGRPNVLQAVLGERSSTSETLALIETNLDDVTGELLAHVLARLLAAGAADAWATPIVMKKGRPAHMVSVLVSPALAVACEALLLRETGGLGARRTTVERTALPRHTTVVDVLGHPVRVKHGPHGAKPEHDDVAAVAEATGRPWREVADRARVAPPVSN